VTFGLLLVALVAVWCINYGS